MVPLSEKQGVSGSGVVLLRPITGSSGSLKYDRSSTCNQAVKQQKLTLRATAGAAASLLSVCEGLLFW